MPDPMKKLFALIRRIRLSLRRRLFPRYQKDEDLGRILDRVLSSDLVMVDGGARGGTYDLPRLSRYIASYGFEPNRPEYEKITKGLFTKNPRYKHVHYSPFALVEETGTVTLYITKRPAATSTLRPNVELYTHFPDDNWRQSGEVVGEEMVEGISLADFMRQGKLSYIDYLKLDTQGNELHILKSAGEFLPRIGVVKTEVEMVPMYVDQPLLGDICTFMHKAGFHLFNFQWTDACRRYHFSPTLPFDSYQLLWGDAYFVYGPYNFNAERKLEQALVLAQIPGGLDLALYIIQNLPNLSDADKQALFAFYRLPRQPIRIRDWIQERILKRTPPTKEVLRVP
jgi:FkbM family methyltransferase